MATPFDYSGYFLNVGRSILESLAEALSCQGLDVPERSFVGFDRPSQDVCPELVVWIDNIRTWDGDFPDTRSNGRLLCTNGYSFDTHVRIGRCYIDSDEDGQPLDQETLEDWSGALYSDIAALYMGWISQWRAGNVTELSNFELVTTGPVTTYHSGGCAGHEFTITVGTFG